MKLIVSILISLTISAAAWGQTHFPEPKYIINGQPVHSRILELLNPASIDMISIVKTTTPPEIQITTRRIKYLDYDKIVKKAKARGRRNEALSIVVDNKIYDDPRAILIDRSFIKSINLIDHQTIEIRTNLYEERVSKQNSPQIDIRY